MIYADNAATTRISDLAFEKMLPFLREQYGNASSQHTLGSTARRAVKQARRQVAEALGAQPPEVFFTSGGSEANSWVLRGTKEYFKGETIHVITTAIEHPSVLNACRALAPMGAEVTYLPIGNDGVVNINSLQSVMKPNTKLVSIMLANNEIGTVQPLAEIGMFLHSHGVWLHTDAVQAVGHIPVYVKELQVDFLSASAHKFNGAKGTGFLYIRSGISLPSMVYGGEQEHGHRAGTEHVAGITALGHALEESISTLAAEGKKQRLLVKKTIEGLRAAIPDIQINAEHTPKLPGILNITLPHASGEAMMHLLDLKGICVSTSSACNSGKDDPSHVLLALGLSEKQAKSSIRISYGKYNTMEDVEKIVAATADAYEKITRKSPAT